MVVCFTVNPQPYVPIASPKTTPSIAMASPPSGSQVIVKSWTRKISALSCEDDECQETLHVAGLGGCGIYDRIYLSWQYVKIIMELVLDLVLYVIYYFITYIIYKYIWLDVSVISVKYHVYCQWSSRQRSVLSAGYSSIPRLCRIGFAGF
jgi:hypothetical protein